LGATYGEVPSRFSISHTNFQRTAYKLGGSPLIPLFQPFKLQYQVKSIQVPHVELRTQTAQILLTCDCSHQRSRGILAGWSTKFGEGATKFGGEAPLPISRFGPALCAIYKVSIGNIRQDTLLKQSLKSRLTQSKPPPFRVRRVGPESVLQAEVTVCRESVPALTVDTSCPVIRLLPVIHLSRCMLSRRVPSKPRAINVCHQCVCNQSVCHQHVCHQRVCHQGRCVCPAVGRAWRW
jgi:hypothetical protein